jgi:hypothetical protein
MHDPDHSDVADRLRLIDSLLTAAGESVSPLARLLTEAQREIERARQEEDRRSSRDAEVAALRREVEQLRDGMTSRAVIERAKGMLMQAGSVTEAEAFELLTEMSHRRHRKLRDVAADVVAGAPGAQPADVVGAQQADVPRARPHLVTPTQPAPTTDQGSAPT